MSKVLTVRDRLCHTGKSTMESISANPGWIYHRSKGIIVVKDQGCKTGEYHYKLDFIYRGYRYRGLLKKEFPTSDIELQDDIDEWVESVSKSREPETPFLDREDWERCKDMEYTDEKKEGVKQVGKAIQSVNNYCHDFINDVMKDLYPIHSYIWWRHPHGIRKVRVVGCLRGNFIVKWKETEPSLLIDFDRIIHERSPIPEK